ncbi:GGDEF domain-containing protein [Sporosarcina sp. FA9]|uniref:GGDEF domain-containing protein n=1 Tax=Sporosarcina sp. FA9 TaxID=3413030 RepID=UPI003F657BE3
MMGYKGRVFAVGVVIMFNILRYYYYHQYMGLKFEPNFFILTVIFLTVAFIGGKQYDLAKFYAERDPLTNTYNRRVVEKVFNKKVSSCKNKKQKLAIVLIDLNNFKEINDEFGHKTGDELLRFVADILKKNAKKNDVIVRWGGDEFVHIIPNIKPDFKLDYIHTLNNELTLNEIPSMGASIGIAIFPDEGEDFETLIQQADMAMYEMKSHFSHDRVPVAPKI